MPDSTLGRPTFARGVEDLPLEVRHVHHVAVHEADACRRRPRPGRARSASRARPRRSAAPSSGAACAGPSRPPGQQEVAAVALDLLGAERPVLHHRAAPTAPTSGTRPGGWSRSRSRARVSALAASIEREPALAVEDDRRRRVGGGAADAELEEAAADIGGRLDEARRGTRPDRARRSGPAARPASSRRLTSAGPCSGITCRASASISFSVFIIAAPRTESPSAISACSYYHHSGRILRGRLRPGYSRLRKTAIIGR